jgi:hypothetical protein
MNREQSANNRDNNSAVGDKIRQCNIRDAFQGGCVGLYAK